MKTIKMKKVFGTMLSVAVFANAFFLNTTEVSALSCAFPKNIFVAAYEQGIFIDGFVVEHKGTGNSCDTRPIVNERTENLQNIFSIASQNLNQVVSSGVYQLSTRCLAERWDEWCTKDTSLEQLSSNSTELTRYKSEWQQKEQDGLRSATTQKWSVVAIIVDCRTCVVVALDISENMAKLEKAVIFVFNYCDSTASTARSNFARNVHLVTQLMASHSFYFFSCAWFVYSH